MRVVESASKTNNEQKGVAFWANSWGLAVRGSSINKILPVHITSSAGCLYIRWCCYSNLNAHQIPVCLWKKMSFKMASLLTNTIRLLRLEQFSWCHLYLKGFASQAYPMTLLFVHPGCRWHWGWDLGCWKYCSHRFFELHAAFNANDATAHMAYRNVTRQVAFGYVFQELHAW